MDLVPMVLPPSASLGRTPWVWKRVLAGRAEPEFNVVAIDYGISRNILRRFAGEGCKVRWCPATTSATTFWR